MSRITVEKIADSLITGVGVLDVKKKHRFIPLERSSRHHTSKRHIMNYYIAEKIYRS